LSSFIADRSNESIVFDVISVVSSPNMTLKSNIGFVLRDLRRIFSLLRNADPRASAINMLLQLVMALLPAITLYIIKALIDALVKGDKRFDQVIYLVLAFGAAQFLLALASQYAAYINTIYQETLTDHLSAEVLNKAIEVDYAYYENPAYHDTLHLAQLQSLYKAPVLLSNFNALLLSSLSLVFLTGIFFTINWVFALLFIGLSFPLAMIKWYSGYALLRLERKFAPLEREAGHLHHTLTNVTYAKEVRVFGFGQAFIKKFNFIRRNIRDAKQKLNVRFTLYSLLAEAIEIITVTIIFFFLARSAWDKAITVGVFVIYIQGFQRLQSNSKNFLQSVVQLFQQRLFLQDLFAFFDMPPSRRSRKAAQLPQNHTGLSMQNVSFTYPGTEKQVLHHIYMDCAPGQIVAIVGENGSGKSTLVKLLARLYELQSGKVTIDNNDLDDIPVEEFRAQSVFLFQDFERYFLTVEENIALGRNAMSSDAGQRAAKLSGAHDFIKKLSKGYETRMGRLFEGSEQISGGQWQKLALARVFYTDAHLVVLDEPTSALDAVAEWELFKNVKANLGDKMCILITHRLYNLKMADRIYVMQEGQIVEHGSFDELANKGGVFTSLYNAQKL